MGLYMFEKIKYCKMENITDNYQGVIIEVFMTRPLLGNILTQFLPTLLFIFMRYTNITKSKVILRKSNA